MVLNVFDQVEAGVLAFRFSVYALNLRLEDAETVTVDLKAEHGCAVQISFKIFLTELPLLLLRFRQPRLAASTRCHYSPIFVARRQTVLLRSVLLSTLQLQRIVKH